MDAIEQTGSVYALAVTMAKSLPPEELTRAALVFTQLGTTLSVLAALQRLDQNTAAGDTAAADLLALR